MEILGSGYRELLRVFKLRGFCYMYFGTIDSFVVMEEGCDEEGRVRSEGG